MIDLELRANLVTLYNEPHRHYHNFSHILHCMREYHAMQEVDDDDIPKDIEWMELEFAIWFHDAVYDPQAEPLQNEKESSEMAFNYLWAKQYQALKSKLPVHVANMVEATFDHHPEKPITDTTTKVLMDIDMSILGQPNHVYLNYAKNIRKEYSWVPLGTYIQERSKILKGWQELPEIYHTEYFRKRYEASARANIHTELILLAQNWLTE